MAVLARRCIQDLLDDLGTGPRLSKSLTARLNLPGRASLDAEWELIVVSALSRVGAIEYEPQLGGSACLDVRFKSPAGLQFTGEITALSDDEISRRNPIAELVREAHRRLDKRGIRGGITISAGAERQSGAVTLLIPPPHAFSQQIFNQGFLEFMDRVNRAPASPHAYRVHNDIAQVAISYAPGPWRIAVHHTPFKSPRDIVKNALYNRLKKKVAQIKRSAASPAEGLRGIIVCDSNCQLLQSAGDGGMSFGSIARHFLKKTTSLDFVVSLSVKADYSFWSSDDRMKPYGFDVRVVDRLPDREEMIARVFQEGLQQLPRPVRTAMAARFYLEDQQQQGLTALQYRERASPALADGCIGISARAAVDLIAGRIDRKRFETLTDDCLLSALRRVLDAGGMVSSVRLVRDAEADDDTLQVEWRNRDPATTPFESAAPSHIDHS